MKKLILIGLFCVGVFAAPKTASVVSDILWGRGVFGEIIANVSGGRMAVMDSGAIAIRGGLDEATAATDTFYALNLISAGDPDASLIQQEVRKDENYTASGFFSSLIQRESESNISSHVAIGSYNETADNEWHIIASTASASANVLRFNNAIALKGDGSIKAGGSESWKLGSVIPATVQLVTDKYVEVNIGGQVVKLAIVE